MFHHLASATAILWALMLLNASAQGQFTLNIGAAAIPPLPLVEHDDIWRYHLGTNAPQADWKSTLDDGDLDATWDYGPGGFGYGDGDDNTLLTTMSNRYTTVYIRKVFELPTGLDMNRRLRLIMDWDDGFIAWLDDVEIARSPNAPAGEPPHTALSNPPNHDASAAGGPPPTTYDLGPVGTRLAPGFHVLAVMGLNGTRTSSDFSLIADLVLAGSFGGAAADGYFALVHTNTVILSGSNTVAGATRVTVNGLPASYDAAAGTWSRVQTLQPGMNRLFIAALDVQGHILGAITKDIVAELNSVSTGGSISANSVWSGSVRVTNELLVTSGATLTINPGTVVLLTTNAAVRAATNSTVDVAGTREQPIYFLPADATNAWREVGCIGPNSQLRLRHADIVAAQVRVQNGGAGLMEDSVLRDLPSAREVVEADNGADLTIRRSYFARFSELDSQNTPVLIEDSLLEHFLVDGMDIKSTLNLPLIVRRTTFRFADPNNSNADAIDFGPGAGTVERCLIHDFPDKGVSIGGASGTQVRESLIYNCGIGVSAYSSSNVLIESTTIANSRDGILFRDNPQRAVGVASNVIVWDNLNNLAISNTSVISIFSSDIQGFTDPNPDNGNISADPLFFNNYRVPPNSPAAGMGARFPLGGIPPAPFHLAALLDGTNPIRLSWQENAGNENAFLIERSTNGLNWEYLTVVNPNQTSYVDLNTEANQRYFYRVRAENSSGISPWSNVAGGIREEPVTVVGGTLAANTIWSRAMGKILVLSNVIVPANITLQVQAGACVILTNGASIRATAGGTIDIAGTALQPVLLARANGTNNWLELAAEGNNSFLTMRHAETDGGTVKFRNGATGLMEDCYVHHFQTPGSAIGGSTGAREVRVRRCHFAYYHETLWQNGLIIIEDSLFEYANNPSSDALDFDGAVPGSAIRRCTFRHGPRSNTDAIDLGSTSTATVVEDCLMYDFPFDKGVSIGETSFGIVIRNCLMYGCDSGVAVKDSCTAVIYNCTMVQNDFGFKNFNKANPGAPTGGGHITNGWNNILWNNITNVSLLNGSTMTNDHSNLGTNYPGIGNINADPLFVNAAARDYRLTTASPSRGTGRDGADMGARFPVGAPMASSHPQFQSIYRFDYGIRLTFWADSERTYTIYTGPTVTGPWTKLEDIPSPIRPTLTDVYDLPAQVNPTNRFYRLVTPMQP